MRCEEILNRLAYSPLCGPAYNARMRHSNLVVVQSFGTRAEADIALGILESSGIEAMIQADTAGGMRQHLAWGGLGFRVLVCEEDVAMARDVLKAPPESEYVVLKTFATQDEADCAQGVLLSAGIPATIQHDNWRPDVPWTGSGFRVLVHQEDAATAHQALDGSDETHAKP